MSVAVTAMGDACGFGVPADARCAPRGHGGWEGSGGREAVARGSNPRSWIGRAHDAETESASRGDGCVRAVHSPTRSRMWRNWQTRKIQVLVGITPRGGSIPLIRIRSDRTGPTTGRIDRTRPSAGSGRFSVCVGGASGWREVVDAVLPYLSFVPSLLPSFPPSFPPSFVRSCLLAFGGHASAAVPSRRSRSSSAYRGPRHHARGASRARAPRIVIDLGEASPEHDRAPWLRREAEQGLRWPNPRGDRCAAFDPKAYPPRRRGS